MIAADSVPSWLFGSILVVVVIGTFGLLGWAILRVFRGYNRLAEAALSRAYEGVEPSSTPLKGDVRLVFHTYHGLLLWFVQTEHDVFLPPEQAVYLLKRLNRFNCTIGLLSRGLILIPLLSIGNYIGQMRSIRSQTTALTNQEW